MRRLIHAPLTLRQVMAAFLVVAFFLVLLQLALFNFIQNLFWITRENRTPGVFTSGLFILKHAWPLSAAVVALSAGMAALLRSPLGERGRRVAFGAFYVLMSLLGVFSTILFISAMLGNDDTAVSLWGPATVSQWVRLFTTPSIFFGLLVFIAAGFLVLRAVWSWAVLAFLQAFTHHDFSSAAPPPAKSYSGDDFLEQYKNLLAQAARERRPIGLLGIRISNDLELISRHGKDNYGKVMEELHRFTRQIARRGEFQLLYRGHVVLSVLLAGEQEALQGARRFQQTLGPMLAQRFPEFGLRLSVGVSGYLFSAPVKNEAELSRFAEALFWDATDQAGKAVDGDSIPVNYRKAE